MAGQGLIPGENPLCIRTRIPSRELDDRRLVARLKATKGIRTTYEDFLIARQVHTDMTRESFLRLLEDVSPDPGLHEEWILFAPTHHDRSGFRYMMLEKTREGYRLVREDGILGTCSDKEFPDFFSAF